MEDRKKRLIGRTAMTPGDENFPLAAEIVRENLAPFSAQYSDERKFASKAKTVEPHGMSDMNREEAKARLEASEARVATAVEGMRADNAALRSEIRSQGERSQASADRFYAEAGKVLAEIHLANERQKVELYGLGYKVFSWTLATMFAVAGLSVGAYNALKPKAQAPTLPASQSSQNEPVLGEKSVPKATSAPAR